MGYVLDPFMLDRVTRDTLIIGIVPNINPRFRTTNNKFFTFPATSIVAYHANKRSGISQPRVTHVTYGRVGIRAGVWFYH